MFRMHEHNRNPPTTNLPSVCCDGHRVIPPLSALKQPWRRAAGLVNSSNAYDPSLQAWQGRRQLLCYSEQSMPIADSGRGLRQWLSLKPQSVAATRDSAYKAARHDRSSYQEHHPLLPLLRQQLPTHNECPNTQCRARGMRSLLQASCTKSLSITSITASSQSDLAALIQVCA